MILPSNGSATTPIRARLSRTAFLECLDHRMLEAPQSDEEYLWYPLTGILEIGKDLEDVVVHVVAANLTASVTFQVRARASYDGVAIDDAAYALLTVTTNVEGYHISSAINDRSNFGRFVQFEIGLLGSDQSPGGGTFTVGLAIRFTGQ